MPAVQFNDLPKKALNSIFKRLDQTERQKLRLVCSSWKRLLDEEFPVQLVITEANFQSCFRCPNADTVKIKSLTTEYTNGVAFGPNVHSIEFSGKVLSSNIFKILRYCPELQVLRFSSLKQVLGIQDTESIKLPKTTTVEISVRPDQETFTSDEIIVISVLRQILFGSLNTILISTQSPLDDWEGADDRSQQSQLYGDDGSFTMESMSPMSSINFNSRSNDATSYPSFHMSLPLSENDVDVDDEDDLDEAPLDEDEESIQEGTSPIPPAPAPVEEGTQTANTNLHVIVNRAANFRRPGGRRQSAISSHASSTESNRRIRYNFSEFEARLFYANLEMLVESATNTTTVNVLNGSMSRTRVESPSFSEVVGAPNPAVKHTVFFELVRNNNATLKNLVVKARSDFMCFGNLSSFNKDIPKVQFEEMEYSFGRMQVCGEYTLLRAQNKLRKLRLQVLDDMWKHLMVTVEQSQTTLQDLDVKVLSTNEERVDITAITGCCDLKNLKLLHFFEKQSTTILPTSLNKLVINGPVTYADMETWARDLVELTDLTLLLNVRGDKIDLNLYKRFLKMPNVTKLAFIQVPMDLGGMQKYIDGSNLSSPQSGFKFVINGPREIKELPFVQYVYTFIEPEKFNRDRIVIDDRPEVAQVV